ncbi:MAG: hypothetical protein EA346_14005 [Thioalkalivibrio sp.]|nr:MAG: hypothetical protein EA346_14005 [Thioalkalivibrio sp.]
MGSSTIGVVRSLACTPRAYAISDNGTFSRAFGRVVIAGTLTGFAQHEFGVRAEGLCQDHSAVGQDREDG